MLSQFKTMCPWYVMCDTLELMYKIITFVIDSVYVKDLNWYSGS